MKKLKFKSFHFKEMITNGDRTFVCIKEAQEKFDAWLADVMKDAVVVYHDKQLDDIWTTDRHAKDTHQALLIDIQQIEKKCEKHSPMNKTNDDGYNTRWICRSCGVELIQEWREK